MAKDSEKYTEKETKQRFDAMLKGALKSPPKPMKSIKEGANKRAPTKKSPPK